MAGVVDSRRSPMILAHHRKEPSDEFLLSVMRGLTTPPVDEDKLRSRLEDVKKYDYGLHLGLVYRHPFARLRTLPVQFVVTVRLQGGEMSNGRKASVECPPTDK